MCLWSGDRDALVVCRGFGKALREPVTSGDAFDTTAIISPTHH